MKITRTADKVLFHTNSGIATYSQECNVFAHPRSEKAILIAENGSNQSENETFVVDYDNLEDYKNVAFPVANRDEMIELLAKRYFNFSFKVDDSRFLDTEGNGTGNKNFNGNYSGTLTKAILKPNGRVLSVARLLVFIADSGSVDAGRYGNNITLTNGIEIKHEKQDGHFSKT